MKSEKLMQNIFETFSFHLQVQKLQFGVNTTFLTITITGNNSNKNNK